MTFLVNNLSRSFTGAGFGNKMRDWCDQAGLHECMAHGVRKAVLPLQREWRDRASANGDFRVGHPQAS